MDKNLNDWIIKANEDLEVVNRLTQEGIYAHSAVCFHCQQMVEKYLKVYLLSNGKEISRTHNIEYLLEKCSEIDSTFNNFDPKSLSDFGVQIRYPGDFYMPTDSEVVEYKNIAISIKNFVLSKLPA